MDIAAVKTQIENALPGVALQPVRDSLLIKNPQDILKVAGFLKESADYRLDYLSSLTGADYLQYIEVIYHLYSMEKKTGPLVLRVRADRNQPKVPSLVSVYRGAEYQERETFDMYGIHFENHPDLRRIFMWEGFEGFPMRKDYQQEDSEVLETADVEWLEQHGVQVPDDLRKQAEELKKLGKRAVAQKPSKQEAE
ncbi:MAG TPA: NADH-quinone oxidoreductase subunit C [bacterium]|nr:NADH-quinone oxidoreductase subunit C [bacterium]